MAQVVELNSKSSMAIKGVRKKNIMTSIIKGNK
jgi:hypothetical protein